MRRATPILAALVVLASGAWIFVGVARNRSGEATSELMLTERELPIAPWSNERTGRFLEIEFLRDPAPGSDALPVTPGIGPLALRDLGFEEYPTAADEDRGEQSHRRWESRDGWVVLEYDGEAWARYREARGGDADHLPRLVPVDAGSDPVKLRAKYPDRTRWLVARGRIGRTVVRTGKSPGGGTTATRGVLEGLAVFQVSVPPDKGRELETWRVTERVASDAHAHGPEPRRLGHAPRYRVLIRYGSRYEPWVERIEPIGADRPR